MIVELLFKLQLSQCDLRTDVAIPCQDRNIY